MANIVLLTGFYYPNFSANGSIMKNIADQLKKNHKIKVIAIKNSFELSSSCEYEGYKIVRVSDFHTCFHNYCVRNKRISKGLLGRKYFNTLLQVERLSFLLMKLIKPTSINSTLVSKQVIALKEINEKFPIDIIIPISMPVENLVSAVKYNKINEKVKVIPYQLDHFTESNTLHNFEFIKRLRYKKHLKIEKDILENSYHYFALPQIEKHINKKEFEPFKYKISVCDHPLLTEKQSKIDFKRLEFSNKKINLVFAGSLNKNKRNPIYLLDILKLVPKKNNICLNIFHIGDCNEIIDSYKKELDDNLKNYGQVPLDLSFEAMSEGDILVNLGVIDGNQVSGKIFDYFSFGKPIIHLYFFDEDPNLIYFKDYPMALCLKVDINNIIENVDKMIEFCVKFTGKAMSFEEVEKIFYYATPKFVTTQFSNVIDQID